jgi:hypothetical protein
VRADIPKLLLYQILTALGGGQIISENPCRSVSKKN